MKQKLAQVGLVVVIIVALGFVVQQMRPKPYTYERILVDTQANVIYPHTITVGETPPSFPTESPHSSGRNAYPAYECMVDGTIFAYLEPVYDIGPDDPPPDPDAMMPKCPVCGTWEITIPTLQEGQRSRQITGPVEVVRPGS